MTSMTLLAATFEPALEPDPKFRCSLMQLDSSTCRYPIGDPTEPDFQFCGAPPKSLQAVLRASRGDCLPAHAAHPLTAPAAVHHERAEGSISPVSGSMARVTSTISFIRANPLGRASQRHILA
jgi:hypothetical protein